MEERARQSRVKAVKATLRCMLSQTLSGEKPTPSYSELCLVLMIVASVVNNRTVALGSLTDDNLMPPTVNQPPLRGTTGALLKSQAVEDEQHFGGSRYQLDLMITWWKLWREQGSPAAPPY